MRILQINTLLTGGGTDAQCLHLAVGLHQEGEQVWIAGPAGREISRRIEALGLPFFVTGPEGALKLHFIAEVARFIRRERIDVVHAHHGRDIWPCVLAARLSGMRPRVVLTRHMAKSPSSWFSRRFLLWQCDRLIAVSEFVARVLREGVYEPRARELERRRRPPLLGNLSRIAVVYGGIDTEQFKPRPEPALRKQWGLAPNDYVFAVVGGYPAPRGKGQREFLEAASRVRRQVPHARFLIIGRGDLEGVLREDMVRLGLTKHAKLTGYCEEMPRAMNAIDCLVHPQVGTEAFGLVVCEAHACGRPVIASTVDGIPEAFEIGGNGRLVPPESIEELGRAMVAQAQRGRLSAADQKALHQRVHERLSLSAFARRMIKEYRGILKR